ncbi:MAG TPA: hypothetical protein ENJ15_05200 [Caldithrix abyssi]|uniref:Polysaccharide export protein N-terminal domain-containing protein n=1 Tax=Caldithrix abyssi TaxID=187145 RepID=A0A7V5RQ74_CALAY|nr:hypothetical protein [Caldithrix abyssi]
MNTQHKLLFFLILTLLSVTQLAAFQGTGASKTFHPGDGIYVSTFPDSNSFLNQVFPIDDRGYAEFPIVGKVKVTDMSTRDLSEYLKKTFKIYLKYPNVYVKPMVRVSVLGGFLKPGLYYVDINSSLWDVIYMAGGTVLEDGIEEMKWQRLHDEPDDDVTPYFEQGTSLRAMGFKSGDQIWTPSPDARTIWDAIRDVMPILTFTATVWTLYNTYQRDQILLRTVR